ncbi:MAG: hypothetical protein RLZ98_3633, partial [Pseudomonadota bacterium]
MSDQVNTRNNGQKPRARSVRVLRTRDGGQAGGRERSKPLALRLLAVAAKILLPIVLLFTAGVGILYVRLLNGPISLNSLTVAIEQAVAAELPQFKVDVEDALVLLTDTNAIQFRLANLRFSDHGGRPVAIAPRAALSLSWRALWQMQIAPERIVLIE